MTREEALKVAKPILFNTEMVRAIQGGTKTITRRVLKNQDPERAFNYDYVNDTDGIAREVDLICDMGNNVLEAKVNKIPYFVGDILYVRETWSPVSVNPKRYLYKTHCTEADNLPVKWHPSIHMPKEAARIFLRVTGVRVERLQDSFFKSGNTIFVLLEEGVDIGEQCRECIDTYGSPRCIDDESECGTLDEVRSDYSDLWNSTIKKSDLAKYGWAANPWVWVIEFERIEVE